MGRLSGGIHLDSVAAGLLIICPLAFLGAVIDAIAGGGGLITLPAYYMAGLPIHFAMGTNKFSASLGGLIGTLRFVKNKSIHYPTALPAALMALPGSAAGARLALLTGERTLRVLLLIALPVLAFILLRGDFFKNLPEGNRALPLRRALPISLLIGFILGGYDGFFGPGTGTFITLAFVFIVRLDLGRSMGAARMVNLFSNAAAFATLLMEGRVVFALGVPAALCSVIGGYVGAGLALKKGAKVFKPVLIAVLALLLARVAYDLILA
ncbi:MAG: TSUP family transporter [Oscillospiraceae bacterium]|nr:TSUP family transporter [Oscillospiraceae bacterium]